MVSLNFIDSNKIDRVETLGGFYALNITNKVKNNKSVRETKNNSSPAPSKYSLMSGAKLNKTTIITALMKNIFSKLLNDKSAGAK